ncbi:PAS domain S-box protein [Actinoplanes sp. NPDC051475]|uniref:PAS domain-containing sensor histidine kinase n=1 Tax=Actinoplanes sp. NPDC051475 TaxID=3157225 RepID=UPI00344E31D1
MSRSDHGVMADSEARFRSLFDASPIGMAEAYPDGRGLHVNAALAAMLGYPPDELAAIGLPSVIHPDDRDADRDAGDRLLAGDLPSVQRDQQYVCSDGQVIWCTVTATVVRDAYGVPLQMLWQIVDVTAQRRSQERLAALARDGSESVVTPEALRHREEQSREAFEASPLGMAIADEHGRFIRVNAAFEALLGRPSAEILGCGFAEFTHPDDRVDNERQRQQVGQNPGAVAGFDKRYVRPDGSVVWARLKLTAISGPAGERHRLVQSEDITARRAANAQLQEQARLLELIPAGLIVRSLDGEILWCNAGAEALYGWPLTAATGKTTHRLLRTTFPDGGSVSELTERLRRDGHWEGQLQHLTADGRTVTVFSRQVLHQAEPDEGGDPGTCRVLEINSDVTAARAADQALAESDQRFRAQFTYSAAGQVVLALDGTFIEVNPAYAAMLGRPREQIVGARARDLIHPDDLDTSRHETAALFAGAVDAYTDQARLRHAAGHWVDTEGTISVVRDTVGHPKHLICVVTDVSARRAAERARDEAAAALAARNTELEAANQLKLELIGMLGHEISNPLAAILGYTEILTDPASSLDDYARDRILHTIDRQARRLDDIVREVLAMVSIDAGNLHAKRQPVSLRKQIAQALTATDKEHLPVLGDDATVLVNPAHLLQMLTNLLSNAAKYAGGATAIRILSPTGPDGDGRVRVQVEDNGPGVPQEFRPQLFHRLARADRDATTVKGTGLGLYIVRGLAQANHGEIHHEPNPTGGSLFILALEPAPPG